MYLDCTESFNLLLFYFDKYQHNKTLFFIYSKLDIVQTIRFRVVQICIITLFFPCPKYGKMSLSPSH
jgi:hypothetical protein